MSVPFDPTVANALRARYAEIDAQSRAAAALQPRGGNTIDTIQLSSQDDDDDPDYVPSEEDDYDDEGGPSAPIVPTSGDIIEFVSRGFMEISGDFAIHAAQTERIFNAQKELLLQVLGAAKDSNASLFDCKALLEGVKTEVVGLQRAGEETLRRTDDLLDGQKDVLQQVSLVAKDSQVAGLERVCDELLRRTDELRDGLLEVAKGFAALGSSNRVVVLPPTIPDVVDGEKEAVVGVEEHVEIEPAVEQPQAAAPSSGRRRK